MFENNDKIRFGCNQCGKCCLESPNMTIEEVFEYSNDFIFQTAHHSALSTTKKLLEKNIIDHLTTLGHTIMLPEMDASMFYYIDFSTITYPSYKGCSKLKDNLCSIYGRRPVACRLAPINRNNPESEQYKIVNFYKKMTEEKDWKCTFDEAGLEIINNGEISNQNQNSLYNYNVGSIREFTDQYIKFIGLGTKNYQSNHFKAVFHAMMKGNVMVSDMIVPLQAARFANIASEDLVLHFIENQILLIEKEIDLAKKMKRHEDLQTSRLYARQKDDYIRALKENVFKINSDEIGVI